MASFRAHVAVDVLIADCCFMKAYVALALCYESRLCSPNDQDHAAGS